MKDTLRPGVSRTNRVQVDRDRTIGFMGEEGRVYATPRMIYDIENTCRDLILEHADANEDSVGIEVSVRHLAATLPGMTAEITATVRAVEGRKVTFDVTGKDDLMLSEARTQIFVLALEALQAQRVFDRQQEFFGRDRLFEEIDGAEPGGTDRHLDVRLPGHHHYRRINAELLEVFEERQPVFAGHHHVGEYEIEAVGLNQLQRARGAVAHHGLVPSEAKGARQRCQRVGLVVNDEQARFRLRHASPARHRWPAHAAGQC